MFPQQVTLSIILFSSLIHNTTAAMNNEPMKVRTLSWTRTASGTMYYSYPSPNNTNNNAYLESPAAFETEFRKILSLNMDSHRSRGKSNNFLEEYKAKKLQCLEGYKQIIIEQQLERQT